MPARPGWEWATPSHSSLPPPSRLPPVGAEATGPRDNGLPPPLPAQPPPAGSMSIRAGAFGLVRALPSPSQAQPARGELLVHSTRHSFQDELSAKCFEIPSQTLLRSRSPYLTGTQEPHQHCQEQQLGRRRRRRHPDPPQPGQSPSKGESARSLALPPRRPRAHVDPGLARAVPPRPQTARPDSPGLARPSPRPAPTAPAALAGCPPRPSARPQPGPCAHAFSTSSRKSWVEAGLLRAQPSCEADGTTYLARASVSAGLRGM